MGFGAKSPFAPERGFADTAEGRFYDLTGMPGEQFVNWDKKVQKHLHAEQNLKKRKPAWEAFME